MAKAADVITTRELETALELKGGDDAMDDLHRAIFRRLLDDRWQHSVAETVDITLAARFYERFADHAVSVAKRVVYLVTGTWRRQRTQPEVCHSIRANREGPRHRGSEAVTRLAAHCG